MSWMLLNDTTEQPLLRPGSLDPVHRAKSQHGLSRQVCHWMCRHCYGNNAELLHVVICMLGRNMKPDDRGHWRRRIMCVCDPSQTLFWFKTPSLRRFSPRSSSKKNIGKQRKMYKQPMESMHTVFIRHLSVGIWLHEAEVCWKWCKWVKDIIPRGFQLNEFIQHTWGPFKKHGTMFHHWRDF